MSETMPQEFWQGVEQFNSGQFYACHDTLEALWIEASEPDKTFYQGVLQIAVSLYHLGNDNLRGAAILLGEGSNRLRRYPDSYGGINVEELLSQSAALLKVIQQMGASKIPTSDLGENSALPIPKIVLAND
jgi:predicted metal-dependent hydrolase